MPRYPHQWIHTAPLRPQRLQGKEGGAGLMEPRGESPLRGAQHTGGGQDWGQNFQDPACVLTSCSSSHHIPRSRTAGQGQIGRKEYSAVRDRWLDQSARAPQGPFIQSPAPSPLCHPCPQVPGCRIRSGGRVFKTTVILEPGNGQAAGPIPKDRNGHWTSFWKY